MGPLLGLLAGALLGGIGGFLNALLYEWISPAEMDDLFKAMLARAPFWVCLSLAVALTVGRATSLGARKIFFPTLGAVIIANIIYPLLSMLIFPAARPEVMVPHELGTRLLGFACGGGLLGWALARGGGHRKT